VVRIFPSANFCQIGRISQGGKRSASHGPWSSCCIFVFTLHIFNFHHIITSIAYVLFSLSVRKRVHNRYPISNDFIGKLQFLIAVPVPVLSNIIQRSICYQLDVVPVISNKLKAYSNLYSRQYILEYIIYMLRFNTIHMCYQLQSHGS
jgi:hypothetical protein